jgi:hypothetical protein
MTTPPTLRDLVTAAIAHDSDAPGSYRQCGLGWHDECSDPRGEDCMCPCHPYRAAMAAPALGASLLDVVDAARTALEDAATRGWFHATLENAVDRFTALEQAVIASLELDAEE